MPSTSTENFFGTWPSRSETNNNNNNNNHYNHHHHHHQHQQHNQHNSNNDLTTQFSRTQPSTPRSTPFSSRHNSPSSMPSSPVNMSPLSTSPMSTLRRNYSSTFTLIPEDRAIDTPSTSIMTPTFLKNSTNATNNGLYIHQKQNHKEPNIFTTFGGGVGNSNHNFIIRAIIWWPLLLLHLIKTILVGIFSIITQPLSIAAPTFWLSAFLWIFYKMISIPMNLIQSIKNVFWTSYSNEKFNHTKRTILISGGSTIQTLHLARNFYSAGSRVVVFDFDGLFKLAKYSTAVSKYYTISKPTIDSVHEYIVALCNIVEQEKPSYYIPVNATSVAYFDALAKPNLELLGCVSFIPGAQEVSVLDDMLEVLNKCNQNDISVPTYRILTNKDDLYQLYETENWLTNGYRNILMSCGNFGILDRQKYVLPINRRDLRFTQEISEKHPWIVIRDSPGKHYVTCTTIKESQVVANVTCSIDNGTRSLIPDFNTNIEKWLNHFFTNVQLQRPINGHMSFRFVQCEKTGNLLPLGTRVGVTLPYICYTGVHSRVICKPCKHFSRQNSGPIVQENGRYWIHEAVLNTFKHPSVNAVGKLFGTVLDKREAIFVYWDPLPYCAYYHFQLPFKSVKSLLNRKSSFSVNGNNVNNSANTSNNNNNNNNSTIVSNNHNSHHSHHHSTTLATPVH